MPLPVWLCCYNVYFVCPKVPVTICTLQWAQGSPFFYSFWKAQCLEMMPSWCGQVNWGNCGIPWVNCAVLCERRLERTVLRPAILPVKTAQFTHFLRQMWRQTEKSLFNRVYSAPYTMPLRIVQENSTPGYILFPVSKQRVKDGTDTFPKRRRPSAPSNTPEEQRSHNTVLSASRTNRKRKPSNYSNGGQQSWRHYTGVLISP